MNEQQLVDGVASSTPTKSGPAQLSPDAKKWRVRLSILIGSVYTIYLGWCGFIIASMPSDALEPLAPFALASVAIGVLLIIVIAVFALMRISQFSIPLQNRRRGLIYLVAATIPGLGMSAAAPFFILKEVPLTIDILDTASSYELVAPVTITFTVEPILEKLKQKNFIPVEFKWDTNGDGRVDEDTASPRTTASYDRQGQQTIKVQMIDTNKAEKTATRQFTIARSVFSIFPSPPIVNQPAVLSIAHLLGDPNQLKVVQWDFDYDGKPDETTQQTEITHVFFSTGKATVSAIVVLQNNTQARYDRTFAVIEAPKLPFPVTLTHEPKFLMSSPPFATMWRVDTKEQLNQVLWDFGDGVRAEGARVTHTYDHKGSFPAIAKIFARSGSSAQLSAIVQIVDPLNLPDLRFEGTPAVQGNKIRGEVPLSISLQPKTSTPFVQFSWEAPEATEVGTTNNNFQAIFRREGTYMITLIAHDAENHVQRLPITVEVVPPSSVLSIQMSPESGIAPVVIKFDASETFIPGETVTGFEWTFGDNSPSFIGGASTEHQYLLEGTYSVNLTIRTASGKSFQTSRVISLRSPVLTACILASRVNGKAPMGVQFDSSCSVGNPVGYLWDFADSAQTDEISPVHVFTKPGQYSVKLRVTDSHKRTADQSITVIVKQ